VAIPATPAKHPSPRASTRAASGTGGQERTPSLARDPLAAIAVAAAPIVLEGRYRLLVGSLLKAHRSRKGRWVLAVGSGAFAITFGLLAARHFATTSWPLSKGEPALLAAAGLLLVLAQGFKAYGWGRLFTPDERPRPLALAAGNGGAALVGVVLPGRFDDATRVAVVRRYRPCPASVRALCLSLVMLGLIDCVALAPLAFAAAGLAAAALIVALPRLTASKPVLRFRLGRWLDPRTTSRLAASQSWALVSACWTIRGVAFFLLLGTLGVGFSIPLALLFLCAGAAAAALPIGPAGATTQAGAGAAALITSGVGASQAVSAALTVGALGVLSGTAIFVVAIAWHAGLSRIPTRATA
jgi:hypothetical protein